MVTPSVERSGQEPLLSLDARAVLEHVGAAVVAVNCEGIVSYVNPAAEGLFGWPREELLGRPLSQLTGTSPADEVSTMSRLGSGEGWSGRYTVRRKDGEAVEVLVTDAPLRGPGGDVVGALGISQDLTEMVRLEHRLRTLVTLVENAPVAMLALDLDGTVVRYNRAAERLYGVSADELVGRNVQEMAVTPEVASRVRIALRHLANGTCVMPFVLRHRRGGGQEFDAHVKIAPIHGPANEVVGASAIVQDVTAQQQAERAAAMSERRLRARFEQSPVPRLLTSPAGEVAEVNEALRRLLGGETGELVGRQLAALVYNEDRSRLAQVFDDMRESPYVTRQVELRVDRADAAPVEVRLAVVGVADEHGHCVELSVSLDDLTPQRQAQRRAERDAARFRALVERASDIAVICDTDCVILDVTPAALSQLGHDPQDVVGRSGWDFVHPDDEPRVREVFDRALREPGPQQPIETRIRDHDGNWRWMRNSMTNLLDEPAVAGIVLNLHLVEEQREAEQRLELTETFFRSLVQHSSDIACVTDEHGRVWYASGAAGHVLGYRDDELPGGLLRDLVHPEDRAAVQAVVEGLPTSAEQHRQLDFRIRHAGGEWRWIEAHLTDLRHDDAVGGLVWNLRDATPAHEARAALREREQLYKTVIDTTNEGICVTALDGQILVANQRLAELYGLPLDRLVGASILDVVDPADRVAAYAGLQRRRLGRTDRYETTYQAATGRPLPVLVSAGPLRDPAGELIGTVATLTDITEQKLAQEQLAHAALHDTVTNLSSRSLFLDRLEQAAIHQDGALSTPALVLCNLGQSHQLVNDHFGHDAADELLRHVADRLRSLVQSGDTLARLQGDEFALLRPGTGGLAEGVALAEQVRDVLDSPVALHGQAVTLAPHLGVTAGPVDAGEELLRRASLALHRAGSTVDARIEVFDPARQPSRENLLRLAAEIRTGLDERQFTLHYQPIVSLTNGAIVGSEALVRWNHPDEGLLPPGRFIPAAEETGLIVPLGEWVLHEACRQAATWQALGPAGKPFQTSVNVSAQQLAQPERLSRVVADALARTGLNPGALVLEVTETAVMHNLDAARAALEAIHARGVELAIDDFGTGYSSLTYLRSFPISRLKIDRSFISGLDSDHNDLAITASVASLARAVGATSVAEGVETPEQLAMLQRLGCDHAQGYLWSRPVAPEELTALVANFPLPSRVASQPTLAAPQEAAADPRAIARILELHRSGASLHTIAMALNNEGMRNPVGKRWTWRRVARTIAQLEYPHLGLE